MKKIYSIPLMLILGIALVAAGVGYYSILSTTITVSPSIELSGDCEDTLTDVYDGETYLGNDCVLTNNALSERNLVITTNSPTGIDVTYVGTLELTKKDTTTWIATGDTKTIGYTIIGDTFEITNIPDGYTAIYYPNTEGDVFATNVENVLVYGSDNIGNLPIALDVGDDYCGNGLNLGTFQCVGAKLWLIEGTESEALAKLSSWDASEFYFETSLIQYNSDGEITLSPGASLTITPVYEISAGVSGTKTITTTIE